MKRILVIQPQPLLLLLCLAGALLAMGLVLTGEGRSQDTENVELILETDKARVVLSEPVYLTVRLRNVGTVPVEAAELLDPQTGVVSINVVSPAGTSRGFLPLLYSDVTIPSRRLRPNDEIAAVFPVFFGSLGWTFPQPGKYRLSASYGSNQGEASHKLVSNQLSMVVTSGDEAGSLLIDDSNESFEAGKFLLWQQGDHLKAGLARLQRILATYPESVLADYIRFALGRNFSRSFRDYSRGRVRAPDCHAALSYLEDIKADVLPRYLQILQALAQARCHALQGSQEEAERFLKHAEALGEGRPEFRLVLERARH